MRRKKQAKPDYQHIARLERELGLDDESVLAGAAAKKERSGPVILAPKRSVPLSEFEMRPGMLWRVTDHADVQVLRSPYTMRMSASHGPAQFPVSRVELPPGVRRMGD